ncbi:MAG: hypothetical protein Q9183_006671, partial [Haloplaca sp. 2 TL-2023]
MPRPSAVSKTAAEKKKKQPTKDATKKANPTVEPTIRSKRKAHIAPEHDKDALESLEKERRKRLKDEAGRPKPSAPKPTTTTIAVPHLPTDIIIVKPTREGGQPSPHTTRLNPCNGLAKYLGANRIRVAIQLLGIQSMMPAPSFTEERTDWAFARWFVQPATTVENELDPMFGRGTVMAEEFSAVEKGTIKTVPLVQMAWFE